MCRCLCSPQSGDEAGGRDLAWRGRSLTRSSALPFGIDVEAVAPAKRRWGFARVRPPSGLIEGR